jgi:hypothetical protein
MELVVSQQLEGDRQLETINGLSLIPKWNQPGTSGDSGGASGLNHGSYVWVPGNPGKLTIDPVKRPAGKPWDNFYFYNNIQANRTNAVYFSYAMEVTLPSTADIAACTAWENEIEICEAGLAYNMAWQCKPSKVDGPPAWRLFDLVNQKWVPIVSIPAPVPKSGVAISFLSKFSINRATKTVVHETLTIDGVEYPVQAVHSAKMKWSTGTYYTHNAFQLDSDGKGTPYTVLLGDMTVRRL